MSNTPFIIVGLGNPGPEYTKTRHNAGFWFVELLPDFSSQFTVQKKLHALQAKVTLAGVDCVLLKPQTFMNLSGQAVRAVVNWYKLSAEQIETRLLVVHDELDLPAGAARFKQGGGHGGHNGLKDIERHLNTRNYLRLRIGVDHPGQAHMVSHYLTSGRPSVKDQVEIELAMNNARGVLPLVLNGELPRAMNELHSSKDAKQ